MGSELGEASSPLLEGGSGDEDADVEQLSCSIKYRYYTLPRLRYTNAVRCLMLADLLLIVTSWIFIGTSDYFIRSIVHFTWTGSVFDLVLLTIVKVTTLFILYSKLEDVTLQQIQEPYEPHLQRKKANLHTAIISLSFLSLIYSVVKGSFILYIMKTRPSYTPLHLSEYMISISAIVFGLLSFLLGCLSYKAMRRLKVMRITHHLDEELQEVDKDGKPVKSAVNFSRLFDLIKYEWPLLVIALICTVISVASTTTAPLYFGKVIDASQKSMADLNRTVLILLLVYVGGAIASMFRAWCYELIGQRLVAKLRVDIFKTIINQEIAFFDTNRTGELTNRLSSDTQVVQNLLTVNMSLLIRQTLSIIGSLVFMLVLNAKLTGVLLSVVPIVSLAAVQYGSFVKKIRKLYQDRLADASSTAEEAISGIRTVRSFAREEKTGDIYSDNIDKSYQQGKKLAIAEGGFNGLIGFISYGAVSLVLWYGGKLVIEKKITAGILTSFILYTLNVAVAFGTFSSLYGQFMQAVGASVRIFELRDRKPTVANTGDLEIINLNEGIEFKDVKFTYPSRPDNQVLKGISFKVNHGEMVAVVGPSGGGKSTMVNLIERFYDPDGGSIYLGNTDVRLLNANWFRRQLAMVGQEPILFATSIRDNIAYGKDATIEQIEKVARSANAHEFIADFAEGYDTMVGERGVRLSGGQKQRVAIARALLMDPAVLLLDEATSALDAESEHLVQDAIDRAMNNRTVLVIAHRLSTVRQASKVIVIDDGEIAEQGTHDELIAKDGVYKKLVLRQLMAVDNASSAPEDLAAAADNHIGIDGDHNSMPDTEQ